MIPNLSTVYFSACNLTVSLVAFAARHQVLVWSRFFCDGFKTLFSMLSSLLFLTFFIAVIICYSKLSSRNKNKTNLISRYKHIRSDLFQYLFNCLFTNLFIHLSINIVNAAQSLQCYCKESRPHYIINAVSYYQCYTSLPIMHYITND